MSILELDLTERESIAPSVDAFRDLLEWWQCGCGTELEMSPPLSLGWDIRRQWPNADGFNLWRDLMHVFEPPLLADHLLPGDTRQSVTLDQYEASLVGCWALYNREKHWTDKLIVDVMYSEKERGWQVGGSDWESTEAILNDLAAKCGAKRVAAKAERDARNDRHCRRVARYHELDDAGYTKWLADCRPDGNGLKFDRWSHRHFRERLQAVKQPLSIVPAAPLPDLLKSSGEFVTSFEPPDFLIDGVLQRRYFYSLTASTGSGKTAIAMRLAGHVATGRPINDVAVEQGTVLYFAGENPSDVQARWLGLTRSMGIEPTTAPVHFVVGAMDLTQVAAHITSEVIRKGLQLAFVVVDTAAAYNFSEDENSNTQAGAYARHLRSLTQLPGGPCVVVLCHPTKRAGDDDLIPRGGGAFLAEVDGNIAVQRRDSLLVASPQGKFRGTEFAELRFELDVMRDHPKLRDTRGRPIPTVIAKPVAGDKPGFMEKRSDQDDETVLRAVSDKPGSNPTDLAKAIRWTYGTKNEPNRTKVARVLARLQKEKLVVERLGGWRSTPAGDKELNALDLSRPILPTSPPNF
jgi:hypothetical protein